MTLTIVSPKSLGRPAVRICRRVPLFADAKTRCLGARMPSDRRVIRVGRRHLAARRVNRVARGVLHGVSALLWLVLAPSASAQPARSAMYVETEVQRYDVRSVQAEAFTARRRLVQVVGFDAEPYRLVEDQHVMRVTSSVQLRLNQEFGDTCLLDEDICAAAVNPNALDSYEPLARDTTLEVPFAYVQVDGVLPHLGAQVGRHLVRDAPRMTRVDGVSVWYAPSFLRASAYAGSAAYAGPLGARSGAPLGALRVDEDGHEISRVYVTGARLELRHRPYGFVAAAGEWAVRAPLRDSDAVARPVVFSLGSAPAPLGELGRFRVHARSQFETLGAMRLSELDAEGAVELGIDPEGRSAHRVSARYRYYRPHFDLGSIWAFFAVDTFHQLGLEERWRVPFRALERLEAEVMTRYRVQDGEMGRAEPGVRLRGTGAVGPVTWGLGATGFGVHVVDQVPAAPDVTRPDDPSDVTYRRRAELSFSGDIGTRFGALSLQLMASFWRPVSGDVFRARLPAQVTSEGLWVEYALGDMTRLGGLLEHGYGSAGHTYRGTLRMSLEVWR